jgi:membrane associated rhomboid family serine protease
MQQKQNLDVQIETQGAVPIATMLLIFCMVIMFSMMCQNKMDFWNSHLGAMNWAENNASVQAANMATWMRDNNYSRLLTQIAYAGTCSLTGWQLVANCYFTWFFGSTLEQKLGPGRILLLVILAMIVPYSAIVWDCLRTGDISRYYIGPLYVISALYGATMVFPEQKKIKQWFKKTRGEIFSREPLQSASAKFKVNAGLVSCIFILFEAGVWYYTNKFMPDFSTFHWLGTLAAVFVGYGVAFSMVWSATGDLREGPVKLMCIRKYNDTLKLDVGHEAAVRTTAMALGLPEDRVKQWVAKQKGKMKIS